MEKGIIRNGSRSSTRRCFRYPLLLLCYMCHVRIFSCIHKIICTTPDDTATNAFGCILSSRIRDRNLHPSHRDVLSSTRTHMRWMCVVHAHSCVVSHTSPLPPHRTVILVHHASTKFGLPNFNMLEYTCHIVAEKHIFSQKRDLLLQFMVAQVIFIFRWRKDAVFYLVALDFGETTTCPN